MGANALTFLLLWNEQKLNRRCLDISKSVDRKAESLVNEDITAEVVLVIDVEGTSLGNMKTEEAIKLAEKQNLDLVCVAPNAKVPVCRFMDYSKYRYDLQRKARDAKKNQKVVTVKELRVSPVIGENDFETKLKNGRDFLQEGNKLKIALYYPKKKRRLLQMESSSAVLDRFATGLSDIAVVEAKTVVEGKTMAIVLTQKKK